MAEPVTKPSSTPSTPTPEERAAYIRDHVDFEEPDDQRAGAATTSAAPAPAATIKVPPAPAKVEHSNLWRRAALEIGMSDEDIDATPKDDLRDYVRYTQDRRDREARVPAAPPRTPNATSAEPTAATGQPTVETEKPASNELKLDWGKDADIIDPEVRSVIEAAVSPLVKEIMRLRGLNEDVGHLKNFVGRQQAETRYSAIDKKFAEFDPEGALYGKGTRADLKADGPEMAKRLSVLGLAEKITAAQGDKADYWRALGAAHKLLFGTNTPSTAVTTEPAPARPKQKRNADGTFGEPVDETEEWERATLARPTSRVSTPERGMKAAKNEFERGLEEIAARNGKPAGDGEDDEF